MISKNLTNEVGRKLSWLVGPAASHFLGSAESKCLARSHISSGMESPVSVVSNFGALHTHTHTQTTVPLPLGSHLVSRWLTQNFTPWIFSRCFVCQEGKHPVPRGLFSPLSISRSCGRHHVPWLPFFGIFVQKIEKPDYIIQAFLEPCCNTTLLTPLHSPGLPL